MFGLDLLDTFGDWIQLIFATIAFIIGHTFLSSIAGGLSSTNKGLYTIAPWVYLFVIVKVMWITVYDYDLVVAYLLGGILSAVFGVAGSPMDRTLPAVHATGNIVITGLAVSITMIVKIILFW